MLPEVVLFSKTENSVSRDSDLFVPDVKCLIIFQIYGRIKTVCSQSYYLCEEFPGPVDSFCLKIVTKGEVTKHFKECTMACGFTYILDITCTDTFLAGTYSCSRRDFSTCKIWFQRSHTCVDQQKTLISLWYQGKAFHYQMSFAFHEVKKHLTKFVYSVFLHNLFLLKSAAPVQQYPPIFL